MLKSRKIKIQWRAYRFFKIGICSWCINSILRKGPPPDRAGPGASKYKAAVPPYIFARFNHDHKAESNCPTTTFRVGHCSHLAGVKLITKKYRRAARVWRQWAVIKMRSDSQSREVMACLSPFVEQCQKVYLIASHLSAPGTCGNVRVYCSSLLVYQR